jgi:DNA (cytosine-5)-methyltransferase 1
MNYYNENDPFAAAWLRELIADGLIADGVVDDRSILDVEPKDIEGFKQHHFFAGIGGWSAALRIAGWADDRPVCTASLPCQPFSAAGNNKGKEDERHLLPHFMRLVRQCSFNTIMGEQVEAAVRHGWLDDLQANMEAEGYSTGAVVLGAHSVNAPHKRQRLYWVADRNNEGLQRHGRFKQEHDKKGRPQSMRLAGEGGFWDEAGARCGDGKQRPVPSEPALFPLADGVSNRVGMLRGAGNAIVPQVAAKVIESFMESKEL